jgi:methylase of polypeptide subunit release factors
MADTKDERRRYGQHYTPEAVASLLAAFAIRSGNDLVFDPSCGDGRLLKQALAVKQILNDAARTGLYTSAATHAKADSSTELLKQQVFGIDRSLNAASLAATTGARVAQADFFDVEPGSNLPPEIVLPKLFDSVIGNPPYIRQELMGAAQKELIGARLANEPRVNGKNRRHRGPGNGVLSGDDLPFLEDAGLGTELFMPEWSGRSDIYVYFFAHAARFLRRGGRLVFITSSSWLDVGYGAALQEFLLQNFRIVAVLESRAESFFDEASINTTITVLDREPDALSRSNGLVRFVQFLAALADILSKQGSDRDRPEESIQRSAIRLARTIENAEPGAAGDAGFRIRAVRQASLVTRQAAPGKNKHKNGRSMDLKWGKYIRAADVFFQVLEKGTERLRALGEMAEVRFGVKTGANDFFYLKEVGLSEHPAGELAIHSGMKSLNEMAFVRRGITTGANEFFYLKPAADASDGRHDNGDAATFSESKEALFEDGAGVQHSLEPRYVTPVIFSLKEIKTICLEDWKPSRFFFRCCLRKQELAGSAAFGYIEHGERAGYNRRPSCASRDPWYAVARGMEPAPLIFPSKVGERWVVAINKPGAFEDKKLYGISPRANIKPELLAALLNSTWARYYAEMTCRQMTGAQAIADIDVVVAEQIMLPDAASISAEHGRLLVDALGVLARRPIVSIFKEIDCADRRQLDDLVLSAIGFQDSTERQDVLEKLYVAVTEVVRARVSRSGSGH